jgi:uncharacterized protein YcbX
MSGQSSARATVVALGRYPVKSMRGEDLNAAEVGERGLLGDRAYALIDAADGKVVSAKNPRKWPAMFACRADFVVPPEASLVPPVRITLPDGSQVQSDQPDVHERLSAVLGRPVRLVAQCPPRPSLEEYWPDLEGLPHRDTVSEEEIPEGTFFDAALVHLLTTATLDRLRTLTPASRFEARRFRPNIVVDVRQGGDPGDAAAAVGFVENAWIGHTLAIGPDVRLKVTGPCPRCVMTTLAQSDLPHDPGVLRAAVAHNGGNVGVYASVLRGGRIRCGDAIHIE